MIKHKLVKNDILFDKEQEDIIRFRFGNGLDKRPVGRATVQRKMIKLPEWLVMKDKLKKLSFLPEENRK